MKFSAQTKDGAIDNLLRAYVSKPGSPHQVCPDFDPDQANAYIEKSLTSGVRLQYETHLSACSACRKSVVALMRMAEADSLAAVTRTMVSEVPRSTWLSGIRQMLGALSRPQWAMAAAAVVVLAVSMPLLLPLSQKREASQTVASQPPADTAVTAVSPASPSANGRSSDAPHNLIAAAKQPENTGGKPDLVAKDSAAATTQEAAGFVARMDAAKKTDTTKSAVDAVDESQRKAESQVAGAPAQAGVAPGAPARSDADQTRQKQQDRDAAQQVSESKLATRVNEERAKEKNERAEDVAPPPAPRASDDGRGRMRRPSSHALRDSNSAEAVRPEERKFNGKKFFFKDGAWTDKDFDPNKDLPIVTIIRDSNVYNEVLNKRPGLKPFLTGFQASERAIIVYKSTVYKLIPQ